MRARSAARGFALIEVVVAVAISGILLLGARILLEQLADGADRLLESAATVDRRANADRLLRELVGHVAAATEVHGAVSGNGRAARLSTWCNVPAGWLERCQVSLSLESVGDESALTMAFETGGVVVIRRGFQTGEILYLTDARAGGSWLHAWRSTITTPLALGIVLDRDTLIVRIGERG